MKCPPPTAEFALEALVDPAHPIKIAVADWARTELADDDMIERDRTSSFARDAWKACAAHGLMASTVPAERGGSGDDIITTLLKLEGLGLGSRDNGLGFAIASQVLSFQEALLAFGSDEQLDELIPGICSGDVIGAFAITEPESGSDTYSLSTTAAKTDDGYVLTGHKAHVTLAPVADVAIVFANTRPEVGKWGISAFLVRADRDGVSFTENHDKMGLRTTPFGDIVLDGYLAPESDRLGPEGAGLSIFATCMESERGFIFATQLGAAERVIGDAIDRARTREQFGQPIGAFQAVSHRLVDMQVRLESARLLMYRTAALVGTGRQATREAAMSKLVASEAVASIALDASRVHGARGYVSAYEVEREVRDALGGLVYSGTSDIQRNVIARLMELPQ